MGAASLSLHLESLVRKREQKALEHNVGKVTTEYISSDYQTQARGLLDLTDQIHAYPSSIPSFSFNGSLEILPARSNEHLEVLHTDQPDIR